MTPERAILLAALPYAGAVAWLLRSPGAFPCLALGWVIAVLASYPPTLAPTRGRHADVGWFQRTDLGEALTYREGWVPARVRPWTWLLAAGLLFGPGAWIGWRVVGPLPLEAASLGTFLGDVLASPVAVLSAGVLADGLLVQPLVAPFIGLMGGIVLIASAHDGNWTIVWNILAGTLAYAALLYAVDLARLIRRELEAAGRSPPASP